MSNSYNDQYEENLREQGYDKGYEDCKSEMAMKIQTVLRYCLYTKGSSSFEMASSIGRLFDDKAVSVG